MPKLDLTSALAIKGAWGETIAIKGAGFSWVSPLVGPIRTASTYSQTIGFEGNSQLVVIPGPEHAGEFETIWEAAGSGTVARTFVAGGSLGGIDDGSEISTSVWAQDGAGRNASFSSGGLLCINEGLTSGQFASGFPDPGTDQDDVTLTYVGGYLRETARIGADALVIVSNYPHRDYPLWDEPLQHAQFWRQHAMMHNSGNIWIYPFSWVMQAANGYYGSNAFYADPVHLNDTAYPALISAIALSFEYFCTKSLPATYGSLSGDTLALLDLFMVEISRYRYSGFGGMDAPDDLLFNGEPLSVSNDPLPSPGLLPGEPGGPVAPSFTVAPSITPSTGNVGQVYTIDLGTYAGDTPITPSWTLTHSVDGDVTGDVVSGEYDSTGASEGTLTLSVTITNAAGSAGPATDTAGITAAAGLTPIAEMTPTTTSGFTVVGGTLPAASSGSRTITASTTGVYTVDLSLAVGNVKYVCLAFQTPGSFSDIMEIFSFKTGAGYGPDPSVRIGANGYMGGYGAFVNGSSSTSLDGSAGLTGNWTIMEFWMDETDTAYMSLDGAAATSVAFDTSDFSSTHVGLGLVHSGSTLSVSYAAFRVYDTIPNSTERADIRSWATALIP